MTTPPGKGSLFVIFLIVFVDLLGFGMVLPLLPIYAKQFGEDNQGWKVGLLMSCFSAMQFLFSPLWGRLSDQIGRRPVLLVGLLGSAFFYAMFGVASAVHNITLLFVSRIGAGITGATISTAQAYIADSTTLENRAKGMALIGAAFGIGFTFGPLIGAAAMSIMPAEDLGVSPAPGYAAAVLSAISLALAIFLLPESRTSDNQPNERHSWNLTAWSDALATPSVGALLLASFISVVAFGGFESTISLVLKNEFAYSPKQVLFLFAYIGFVLSMVQGGIVRRLSGKVSEVKLAVAGGVLTIAGLVLLVSVLKLNSQVLLYIAIAVEVAGFSFMTPSIQSLISRRSDPAKQGSVMGVSQSVSALARIVAPLFAIRLFHITPSLPYLAAVGLMILGLLALIAAAGRGGDFAAKNAA